MKMTTRLIVSATALAAALSALPAVAEENHFAGAYAVISNEWKSASASVDGGSINASESAPSIALGYNFALNARTTLGFKVASDIKSGEYGKGVTHRGDTAVEERQHYSLAIEPGYVLNDHALVFGILAWHSAKARLLVDEERQGESNLTGLGYGIGGKYTLSHHLFVMGEIQKVSYDSQTIGGSNVKPSSTVVAVGLGYHF
jgi:opacity protein-like surface antigen